MKLSILLLVLGSCLHAQMDRAFAALEKQRASIRKQMSASGPISGFFTTPWTEPLSKPEPLSSVSAAAAVAPGDCEAMSSEALDKLVSEQAQKNDISPKLVHALIRRESGGKPCAVSSKGAQGLMQLMPSAQADMGVQNAFDPNDNVAGGVKYLKAMMDRYSGNKALALAAYNAGPQRVAVENGRVPDIPETQAYVTAILADLNEE